MLRFAADKSPHASPGASASVQRTRWLIFCSWIASKGGGVCLVARLRKTCQGSRGSPGPPSEARSCDPRPGTSVTAASEYRVLPTAHLHATFTGSADEDLQ